MSDPEKILAEANADFSHGRFAEAADGYRHVLQSHPEIAELYINLGAALRQAGDIDGAEAAYRDALAKQPGSALAWFNLGNLLRMSKRAEEALAAFRKADALQPGTPEILNNLGVQLYDMGAIREALGCYDAALAARPDFADALTNRGNALQRLSHMDEADASIERALTLDPGNAVYRLNKSAFLAAAGRHKEALEWADKALLSDPGYSEAQLKRASLLIQQGDIAAGFAAYEARWKIPGWHKLADSLPMPMWQGEDLQGKKLLVWNEQGFGDALLYARYIPELIGRGAQLTLMCEKSLIRLFRQSFADTLEICDLQAPLSEAGAGADFHLSMMSLPHRMQTRLETIPAPVPYLVPDAGACSRWRQTLKEIAAGRLTVGLVWAGNPGQSHDYTRSMPPETMAPLLDIDGICFVNLLVGPRGNLWRDPRLVDVRDQLADFAESAALMSVLDLVISVDSAPAHLAGALGLPVWILLAFDPDSRYMLGTDSTPWYPTATLLRQAAPGDWPGVVKDLKSALITRLEKN